MQRLSALPVALVAAAVTVGAIACGPKPKGNVDTVEVRGFGDPVYVSDTAAGARVVAAALAAARAASPAGEAGTLETGESPFVRVTFLASEKVAGAPVDEVVAVPAGAGLSLLARRANETAWRRLSAPPEAAAPFLAEVERATSVALAAAFAGDAEARAGVERAAARLEEEDGLPPDRVVVVEAVEWPDASLGCPEPGRMYAQVVTPGFRIVFEAAGARAEFHTARRGDAVVRCGGT